VRNQAFGAGEAAGHAKTSGFIARDISGDYGSSLAVYIAFILSNHYAADG
jgi:hypothetical protein